MKEWWLSSPSARKKSSRSWQKSLRSSTPDHSHSSTINYWLSYILSIYLSYYTNCQLSLQPSQQLLSYCNQNRPFMETLCPSFFVRFSRSFSCLFYFLSTSSTLFFMSLTIAIEFLSLTAIPEDILGRAPSYSSRNVLSSSSFEK